MPHRTSARLFESGDFTSHAGLPLKWKLECDAIHPDEWKALAKMVMDYQDRPFYKAVGIPRGGLPFAAAMNEYASGNENDQIMICDDVLQQAQVCENLLQKIILCGVQDKASVG